MWVERGRERRKRKNQGDDSGQGHFSMCGSGVLLRSMLTTHPSRRLDAHVRRGRGSILYWVIFLPSEILPQVTIACTQGTLCRCVSLVRALAGSQSQFRLWRPSRHVQRTSRVQENTLQAKQLRCGTRQTMILRFAGAECNHGLSFAVRADCHPASTHNQKHSS